MPQKPNAHRLGPPPKPRLFTFIPIRKRAAVTSTGGLGSFLQRDCSLTFYNRLSCFCRAVFYSAPLFLLWNLSLRSCHFGLHSMPSLPVVAEGFGAVVAVVVEFPGGTLSLTFTRPSESSPWSSLGCEPNARRLGPPPRRVLTRSVQTANGRRSRARHC